MADKKEKKEKVKGGGDKLKLIIIVLLVLIIVGGASAAGWLIFFNKPAAAEGKTDTTNVQKVVITNDPNITAYESSEFTLAMDEFLVNLSDEGGKKYLKVKMVLGYNTKEKKKFPAELEEKKAILRDTINSALMAKKSADFSAKGREDLKKEILNRVNVNLEYGKINNVFFTDIVIQ